MYLVDEDEALILSEYNKGKDEHVLTFKKLRSSDGQQEKKRNGCSDFIYWNLSTEGSPTFLMQFV